MNPHPLTEAWEQFQKENPDTFDPDILAKPMHSEFLYNRIRNAFESAYVAGELAERKRIVEKIGEAENL